MSPRVPMEKFGIWIRSSLAALATWRITHMLAFEDGPADLFARLREHLGDSFFGKLMDCFQCLSVWVAAPVALLLTRRPVEIFLACFGLSGAACLLERLVANPVVIESINNVTDERKEN